MSRLTRKNGIFDENGNKIQNLNGYHTNSDADRFAQKEIYKLGQLEDVLEEFGIESVQELKARLQSESQLTKAGYELALENEDLTKQLSKAIVPKFEITQEVYIVDTITETFYKTQICSIRIFDGYEFAYYCKYDNDNHEKICLEVDEEFVFTSKAEAQQKLDEIRRK